MVFSSFYSIKLEIDTHAQNTYSTTKKANLFTNTILVRFYSNDDNFTHNDIFGIEQSF